MSTIDSSTPRHRTGSEAWARPWRRATPPIRRVVGLADVAALPGHIVSNPALTEATYDADRRHRLDG